MLWGWSSFIPLRHGTIYREICRNPNNQDDNLQVNKKVQENWFGFGSQKRRRNTTVMMLLQS